MKRIMNYLSMAVLALVGAAMTGCSSDDNIIGNPQQPQEKANVVTLTATVNFDDAAGGTTRALDIDYTAKTLTKTFAVGDKIAVIYENTSSNKVKAETVALTADDITNKGKSATFTVTLTNPKEGGSVKYIYPAAMAGDSDVDYSNLDEQDGTLETIASDYDLATFEGSLSGTELPASASLANQLAIIAYTIKDNAATPNDLTGTITGMTVSDGTNMYTVTRSAAAGPIYVAIKPTTSAGIAYTATGGTKNYIKSVTDKTYKANNFYQLGLRMAELSAEAVDLGLSVKWASMNVGAESESDYGDYFAWGETEPYYSSQDPLTWKTGKDAGYSWASYQWSAGSKDGSQFSKYTSGYANLDSSDDAATANWGSPWRMPTYDELKELYDTKDNVNYTWTWITVGGHEGYRITRKSTGASIFLPTAGFRVNALHYGQGLSGYYWSSTLYVYEAPPQLAWCLYFSSESISMKRDSRNNGYSVRPVQALPTGALSGKFTINSSGDQINFSQGNLCYVSGKWGFFEHQYEYFGYDQSNNHRDLFGWGTGNNPNQTSTNDGDYGTFNDWGSNIGDKWYTLSIDEWEYLFTTRTVNGGTGEGHSYTLGRSVNGVSGVVLYPDDYTGAAYTGRDWSAFEASGCVFLPAAGRREGTSMYYIGSYGHYWSRTAYSTTIQAYFVFFAGSVSPEYVNNRYFGYSVRLVHPAK